MSRPISDRWDQTQDEGTPPPGLQKQASGKFSQTSNFLKRPPPTCPYHTIQREKMIVTKLKSNPLYGHRYAQKHITMPRNTCNRYYRVHINMEMNEEHHLRSHFRFRKEPNPSDTRVELQSHAWLCKWNTHEHRYDTRGWSTSFMIHTPVIGCFYSPNNPVVYVRVSLF